MNMIEYVNHILLCMFVTWRMLILVQRVCIV